MRVVLGVQFAVPRQVSRTKTWRKPLFEAFEPDLSTGAPEECVGVTARNATNRPEALTDGKTASVPTNAPLGSVEMSWVEAVQAEFTPKQVSRTYTWRPVPDSTTRLV